ncbi:hypothetical protein D3C81_918610 [compost metagenome]
MIPIPGDFDRRPVRIRLRRPAIYRIGKGNDLAESPRSVHTDGNALVRPVAIPVRAAIRLNHLRGQGQPAGADFYRTPYRRFHPRRISRLEIEDIYAVIPKLKARRVRRPGIPAIQ